MVLWVKQPLTGIVYGSRHALAICLSKDFMDHAMYNLTSHNAYTVY